MSWTSIDTCHEPKLGKAEEAASETKHPAPCRCLGALRSSLVPTSKLRGGEAVNRMLPAGTAASQTPRKAGQSGVARLVRKALDILESAPEEALDLARRRRFEGRFCGKEVRRPWGSLQESHSRLRQGSRVGQRCRCVSSRRGLLSVWILCMGLKAGERLTRLTARSVPHSAQGTLRTAFGHMLGRASTPLAKEVAYREGERKGKKGSTSAAR